MSKINPQNDSIAAEYVKSTQKLSQYSLDGEFCFYNEKRVGTTQHAIVKKMKRWEDEIEYWNKIGEEEEVQIAMRQFVDAAQKLRE